MAFKEHALSSPESEEAYIGALLLDPYKCLDSMAMLMPEDFYRPLHGQIFSVIREITSHGIYADYVTVQNELRGRGVEVGLDALSSLQIDTPGIHGVIGWAQIILERSDARRTLHALSDALQDIQGGSDPYEISASLSKELSTLGTPADRKPEGTTLEYLESLGDTTSRVVIPGLLREDWRTIVVGAEGSSKSTILRTIAIATAQGRHPLWFSTKIPPMRVLVVDLENPIEAITETGSKLKNYIQRMEPDLYDPSRLSIWRRPGGINLRTQRDRADLQREIINHQPNLVVMGPIYKMYSRNSSESYEESTEDIQRILDDLRTKYGFALLLEHHAPKPSAGQKRDMTPFGSSLWLRWPEVGASLYADKSDPRRIHVRRFRGDRLSGVLWPDEIVRDSNTIIRGHWSEGAPETITRSSR
jgi:replicative DNA helicase